MNKAELINAIANETGLSKKDTEATINSFVNVVSNELEKKEKHMLSVENNFIPVVKNIVDGYGTIKDISMKNKLLKAIIKRIEYIKETKNTRGKRDNDNFSLIIYPIIPYKNNIRI